METTRQTIERHAKTVGAVTARNIHAATRSHSRIGTVLQRGAAIGAMAAMLATTVPSQARASHGDVPGGARTAVTSTHENDARGSLPPLAKMIGTAVERTRPEAGPSRNAFILEKDQGRYCELGRDSQRVLEASSQHQQGRVEYREAVAEHNAAIDAARSRTKRNMIVSTAAAVGVIVASNAIGSKAHASGLMPRTAAKPGKYIAIGAAAIGAYKTLRDAQAGPGGMSLRRAKHVTIPDHMSARFDQRVVRAPDCRDTNSFMVDNAAGSGGQRTAALTRNPGRNTAVAQVAARMLRENRSAGATRSVEPAASKRAGSLDGGTRTGRAPSAAPARPTITNPGRASHVRAPSRGNGNNSIQEAQRGATR